MLVGAGTSIHTARGEDYGEFHNHENCFMALAAGDSCSMIIPIWEHK